MFLSCSTIGGLRSTSDDELFLFDQIQTLRRVRDAGYNHIEIFMNDRAPSVVESVAQTVEDLELIPFSIHLPKFIAAYDQEDFSRVSNTVFSFIERLDIKVAVVHPSKRTILESSSWAKMMDQLLSMAEQVSCLLTLENVPYIERIDEYLLRHLQLMRDRPLGITLDLEYVHFNGSDLVQLVSAFGGDLLNVHCRDSDGSLIDQAGRRKYLAPGDGEINFQAVFETLHDGGYRGPITIEVSHRAKEDIIAAKQFIEDILRRIS